MQKHMKMQEKIPQTSKANQPKPYHQPWQPNNLHKCPVEEVVAKRNQKRTVNTLQRSCNIFKVRITLIPLVLIRWIVHGMARSGIPSK